MMILGVMFMISVQPIVMVIGLIFITLGYSLCVYMMMGSYWFSYGLVMVMLSGVLVVFTYMASLSPNESFEVNGIVFMGGLGFLMYGDLWVYGEDTGFVSLNLWVSYVGFVNLFLVTFLLGVMIGSVWLSYVSEGAIRIN